MKLLTVIVHCFILLQGCNHLFYYPSSHVYSDPRQYGISFEEFQINLVDGKEYVHGWYFPHSGKKFKGVVIQFHGNAQNMTSHYQSVIWMTQHGYDLYTFDYRGYGKSPGKADQLSTISDGKAVLNYVYDQYDFTDTDLQFIVIGQSLGGAVAMASLAQLSQDQKSVTKDLTLLVIDSSFSSYKQVAKNSLKRSVLLWPLLPFAYALVWDKYNYQQFFNSLSLPYLLVIHAIEDPTVPYREGQYIYKNYQGKKEFWTLDSEQARQSHIGAFYVDQGRWRQQLLEILSN